MSKTLSLSPPSHPAALPWPDHPLAAAALIGGFPLLRLLLAVTTPLLPQEAYYWSWSLHPALSYFDHPPLVSWGIGLRPPPRMAKAVPGLARAAAAPPGPS